MFVSDISNGALSNQVGNFGKSLLVFESNGQAANSQQTFPPPPPSSEFVDSITASDPTTSPTSDLAPSDNPALLARAIRAYNRASAAY